MTLLLEYANDEAKPQENGEILMLSHEERQAERRELPGSRFSNPEDIEFMRVLEEYYEYHELGIELDIVEAMGSIFPIVEVVPAHLQCRKPWTWPGGRTGSRGDTKRERWTE